MTWTIQLKGFKRFKVQCLGLKINFMKFSLRLHPVLNKSSRTMSSFCNWYLVKRKTVFVNIRNTFCPNYCETFILCIFNIFFCYTSSTSNTKLSGTKSVSQKVDSDYLPSHHTSPGLIFFQFLAGNQLYDI